MTDTSIDNFEIFTLPTGLRCIVRSNDGPCYCRFTIGAGSRDDPALFPGMAHFVEHTVFRGSRKRTGRQINARAEDVGGSINAYTSREDTVYYAVTPRGEFSRCLELLVDLIGNPAFPPTELEKEKTIIFEEIKSDIDSPDEAIFDELASLLYAGSPIGHNILGTIDSVQSISSEVAQDFVKNLYTPANMVLSCVADLPASKMRHIIEKTASLLNARETKLHRTSVPDAPHFDIVRDKKLNQCHTVMATRTFGYHDARKYAMLLLRYHLSAGMNSVLVRELREKRGYVYNVDASSNLYSDTGNFYIYFGCDHRNLDKCRRLVIRVLEDMANSPMKPTVFSRLLRNFSGRLDILNSAINKRAANAASQLLHLDHVTSREEDRAILTSLTPADLSDCAALLLNNELSVLTYR